MEAQDKEKMQRQGRIDAQGNHCATSKTLKCNQWSATKAYTKGYDNIKWNK